VARSYKQSVVARHESKSELLMCTKNEAKLYNGWKQVCPEDEEEEAEDEDGRGLCCCCRERKMLTLMRAPRALFFISPLTGFGFVSRGFIVYAHQRAYIYIFE
jgi:hypothetical protein